jgi:hypothetical protein
MHVSQARTVYDRSWGVPVSRAGGPLPPSRPAAPNYKIDTSRPWTATAQITNTSTEMMSSAQNG